MEPARLSTLDTLETFGIFNTSNASNTSNTFDASYTSDLDSRIPLTPTSPLLLAARFSTLQLDMTEAHRVPISNARLSQSLPPDLPPSPSPDTPSPANDYFAIWRGRKIQLPGPLPWPCDSLELERVEAQHWLLRLLLGWPYLGPVAAILKAAGESGRARVLDIATGVGVWAVDMAELYPWAEVVGVDNAPVQDT